MKTRLKLLARKCGSFLMFLFFFALALNASGKPAQASMSAVEIASALDYVSPRLDELQESRGSLASCGCRRPRANPDGMAQARPAEVCDLTARVKQDLTQVFEDAFESSYDPTNFEMRAERVIENYSCNDKEAALADLSELYQKALARATILSVPLVAFASPDKFRIAKNRLKDFSRSDETTPQGSPPAPATPPAPETPSEPNPSPAVTPAPTSGEAVPSNTETADPVDSPTIQPAAIPLANPEGPQGGSGNGGTFGPLNPQAITGGGCSLGESAGATMNPLVYLLLLLAPLLVVEILRKGLITQEDMEGWFKGLSLPLEL